MPLAPREPPQSDPGGLAPWRAAPSRAASQPLWRPVMGALFLGIDISKGYADFCFCGPSGARLGPQLRCDDTPAGHAALREAVQDRLRRLPASPPDALTSTPAPPRLVMGVEASGGLERNWLLTLRALPTALAAAPESRVYRLNPLAVKRFRDQELHQSVTDASSARTIAAFLYAGRQNPHAATAPEPELEGVLTRFRFTCNCIDRHVQVQNELQNLLPVVHPDLVAYARDGFPQWLLAVLRRYPTAPQLARARPATLAKIPYVTLARATALIAVAKTSVAALRDAAVGATVAALAQEVQRRDRQIAALKAALAARLADDPTVARLVTVPGIGLWTAVVLRLELGPLGRFPSGNALVAFAGLDPRYHQSGDGTVRYSISKRGRSEVRAALYMSAQAGLRCNPALRAFYDRLRQKGKRHDVALCACMAKLLRIAYACVTRDEPFDPTRHEPDRRSVAAGPASAPAPAAARTPESGTRAGKVGGAAPDPGVVPSGAWSAPVSAQEARRRRAATASQADVRRRVRDHGAALTEHDTAGGTAAAAPKKSAKRT